MAFQIDPTLKDLKNSFSQLSSTYFMNTHYLNDFNEISNTNDYLNEKSQDEKERLQTTHERTNSHLVKIKQEMQMKAFKEHDYSVKSNLLYTTLVASCFAYIIVILFVKEKLGRNLALIIILSALIALVLLLYIVVKANAYRVDTNWDMYHWGPVAQ